MTRNTINIIFIALGVIIIIISINHLVIIPLFIGLVVTIQGLWSFFKKKNE
tara:strand:+ start:227 stop:379 length:153 start_codon:yes stop_codon:yes gene_type:complete